MVKEQPCPQLLATVPCPVGNKPATVVCLRNHSRDDPAWCWTYCFRHLAPMQPYLWWPGAQMVIFKLTRGLGVYKELLQTDGTWWHTRFQSPESFSHTQKFVRKYLRFVVDFRAELLFLRPLAEVTFVGHGDSSSQKKGKKRKILSKQTEHVHGCRPKSLVTMRASYAAQCSGQTDTVKIGHVALSQIHLEIHVRHPCG